MPESHWEAIVTVQGTDSGLKWLWQTQNNGGAFKIDLGDGVDWIYLWVICRGCGEGSIWITDF